MTDWMRTIELRPFGFGGEEGTLRFAADLKAKTFETTLLDPQGKVLVRNRLVCAYNSEFYMLFHGLAKSAKHCLRNFSPHVQREVVYGSCTSIIWGAEPWQDPFIHKVILYLDRDHEPYTSDQICITLTQKELIRFREFFEEAAKATGYGGS